MSPVLKFTALGLCLLLGCSGNRPTASASTNEPPLSPSPASANRVEQGASPPMTLELESPPGDPQPFAVVPLTARLERSPGFPGNVEVKLMLPVGVELLSGNASATVDGATLKSAHTYEIRLGQNIPTQDLQVLASLRGAGYGATAVATYRFGRSPPRLPSGPGRLVPGLPEGTIGKPPSSMPTRIRRPFSPVSASPDSGPE